MARYGYNRYGTFKYGEVSAASVYYNSEIMAVPTDFHTVTLSWKPILPDPSDGSPTHWKLVRSETGIPDNPENGTTLAGGEYSNIINSYIDDLLIYNLEVSYSLWVFNGSKWIFSGGAYAYSVSDTGLLRQVTNWWPRAWLNAVDGIGDAAGESNDDSLLTMLGAFTFTMDKIRLEASLLALQNNPKYTPSALLPYRVTDLGFVQEPALGDQYHRTLVAAGHPINSYKGTNLGLGIYTTALTHWADDIAVGHNLMLDYNDSSFEESVGRWTASSGTLSVVTYADAAIDSPINLLYDHIFSPRAVAFGNLATAATTAVTLRLPSSLQSPITYGIPIKESTAYVFSGQVTHRTAGISATVKTRIHWYNGLGAYISSTDYGTTITTTENTWQEFLSPSSSAREGLVSPRNAAYATIDIVVTPSSASAANFGIDMLQFAEASKSLEFQDARKILVYVQGEQINYLLNPGFEKGTAFWSGVNSTLELDSTKTSAIVHGTNACKIISTGTDAAIVSDWFPITEGVEYTFSSYIVGGAEQDAILRIEFSSQPTLEEQVAILTDVDGEYYPTTPYYIDSDPVTLSTTEYTVLSVSAVAPPYSKDSGMPLAKVSIYFPDSAAADEFWVDGNIVERGLYTHRYFSGDGGVTPEDPVVDTYYAANDCRWEVTTKYNYVPNPSFETNTTGWTADAGTTLTRVSTDSGSGPLFGAYFGKAVYTTTGSVSTTAYLPRTAVGGEDVVISVYVRSTTGTYTLNGKSFTVPASGSSLWTRLSTTIQLGAGDTTVPVTLTATGGTKFHIDGMQVQYGDCPSSFVDLGDTSTVVLTNPLSTSYSMYAVISENAGGSLGLYMNNYRTKLFRLEETIDSYLPKGSSWAVLPGLHELDYKDLTESLIPSASFELDLFGWVANNSELERKITAGSLVGDTASQGRAYCSVTTDDGASTFGLLTGDINLSPNAGYYVSAAIRPQNSDTLGDYTLTARFYDASGTEINVYSYPDGILSSSSQRVIDDVLVSGTDVTSSGGRETTVEITHTDRWAYIAKAFPSNTISGASYAVVSIAYTSGTYLAGQAFDVDRVVFRQ